jgi:glycosyltransferase involved in cell wall biosynthesis
MTSRAFKPESRPKIIAYTRAFNAETTIRRAIESVINQTHGDFEYYLIDNGSIDQTRIIMEEYADRDGRIRVMGEEAFTVNPKYEYFQKRYPDNYYFCLLDADDEYLPEFFEKTLAFAENNDLDIAAAGSNYIDADSGRVVAQKTIKKELIIEGRAFADEFIQYRGLLGAFWGKFFKFTVFKNRDYSIFPRIQFCDDSILVWTFYEPVKRFGFLAQPLHNYYLYPNSKSRYFNLDRLNDCHTFFHHYKSSLERFGPISSLNMDYLYAIWLGWIDDFIFRPLCELDLPTEKKLSLLSEVFASRVTKAMLRREADPRFRNLAARGSFLQDVCGWMHAQEESKVSPSRATVAKMLNKILKNMDAYPRGPRKGLGRGPK